MIRSSIQTGRNLGMITLEESLFQLVADGTISPKEGYLQSIDKGFFEQKLKDEGYDLDKSLDELDAFFATDESDAEGKEAASPEKLKERAWKLATDGNLTNRNGARALELISQALQLGEADAEGLMVLAAAHAAKGEFKIAAETAKRATQLAKQEKNSALLPKLKTQLACYKKSQPLP